MNRLHDIFTGDRLSGWTNTKTSRRRSGSTVGTWIALGLTLTLIHVGCGSDDSSEDSGEPVLQLVSRTVDKNDYNQFVTARTAYLSELAGQPGVGDSRLFNSFFSGTSSAVPGQRIALVEITVFDSQEAYQSATAAIDGSDAASQFRATFTEEANLLVRQPDGSTDLGDFDGAALEIAVRDVTDDSRADYDAAQSAFLAELTAIPDTRTVEFEVVESGTITAGYSTYATDEALQETLAFYGSAQVAADFFASFELVSSQFGGALAETSLATIAVPDQFALNNTSAPEDIVAHEQNLYVSDIATGAILRIDLFAQLSGRPVSAEIFVPSPADGEALSTTWGLRIDEDRRRLIANYNINYSFDGNVTAGGQVRAFDLSSGTEVGRWQLPEGTVG
ncbi:MAG: hypothetical protein AAGC55_22455, partial [Myxococcota bacterium]